MGITEDSTTCSTAAVFVGIAAAGGAECHGNWVVDGDPGMDLWPFDVRRFGPPPGAALSAARSTRTPNYYSIAHRTVRRSGARPATAARSTTAAGRGAVFGAKLATSGRIGSPTGVVARRRRGGEHPSFGRSDAFEPSG